MAQVATSEFLLKAIRFNIKTNTGNVEHLNFSVSLTVSLFFSFVMKHKSASHLIKVPLKYKIQSPLFTTIKDKTIDSWNKCIPNVNLVACNWTYNEVSDLMYNWVAKRPDFKSALRVVNMFKKVTSGETRKSMIAEQWKWCTLHRFPGVGWGTWSLTWTWPLKAMQFKLLIILDNPRTLLSMCDAIPRDASGYFKLT